MFQKLVRLNWARCKCRFEYNTWRPKLTVYVYLYSPHRQRKKVKPNDRKAWWTTSSHAFKVILLRIPRGADPFRPYLQTVFFRKLNLHKQKRLVSVLHWQNFSKIEQGIYRNAVQRLRFTRRDSWIWSQAGVLGFGHQHKIAALYGA